MDEVLILNPKKIIRCIFILFAISHFVIMADQTGRDHLFNQGNQLYNEKNYKKAITTYHKLLKQGFESGGLYYNLGNAYYKTGNIGKAILYYEKALKLLPDNENIQFNLKLARLKIRDKIERPPQFIIFQLTRDFIDNLSSTGWALVVTIALLLTAIFFSIFYLSSSQKLRNISRTMTIVFILVAILSSFPLYYRHNMENKGDRGIILEEEVAAIAAPQKNSTTLFLIHEGTKVKILDKDNNWLKIELLDGKQGWINFGAIGVI